MKESNICPKCQSAGVVRVKNFGLASTSNAVRLSQWGAQIAHFDRYVCTACGFIEDYMNLDEKSWQKWIEKQEKENTLDSDFV